MTLAEVLTGLKEVATTGTETYASITKTDALKEASAQPPASAPVVRTTANITATPSVAPWYKAAWVIPSAIGAVVLVVIVVLFRRRK